MKQAFLIACFVLVVTSPAFSQTVAVCSEDEAIADAHLRERSDAARILDVKTNSGVWRDAVGELGWGERRRYIVADFAVFAHKMGIKLPKNFKEMPLDGQLEIQRTLTATIKSRQAAALATTREALQGTMALKDAEIEELNQKRRDGKCEADKAPTVADVSGTWLGSNNIQYTFRQTGISFTWNLQRFSENGNGTIEGTTIKARWSGNNGSGSATGRIAEVKNGRATRIVWGNGIVFSRD